MAGAQNYATDVLNKVDERFYLDSKVSMIVNNGIELDFSNGNNAVTIYQMEVVAENDYQRSGIMRYGALVEIGNTVQTFVLSQDKSFSISIDRGNREDAKMVPAIDEAVKRQVREVSVPTNDIYVLATAAAYALANTQGATAVLSSSNVFQKILDQRAALQEAKVQLEDIYVYVTPTTEAYLWLDPTFKTASNRTNEDRASGVIGTVMGMTIVTVPTSYLPVNYGFLVLSKKVLINPKKFNSIRTGDGFPFGIDGMVAFGRRYSDCFIPTNKGVGLRYHKIA